MRLSALTARVLTPSGAQGLAGWGLDSADGSAVRFKARRSALAPGLVGGEHEFAGGVVCKLHRGFKAHCFASPGQIFARNGGFPLWTSLAAPRSTWIEVVHAE